jgi:hypothetical protein
MAYNQTSGVVEGSFVTPKDSGIVKDTPDGGIYDTSSGTAQQSGVGANILYQSGINANRAEAAADSADASKNAAKVSETNAASSASSASNSASVAGAQASIATNQANTATTQAGIATTQAGISTSGANTATEQANTATEQAGIATTQAGIATSEAETATTKAGEASASASAALTSEQNALASEQASALSEANALASEQAAALSETNAAASESTATTQAGIATSAAETATEQAGIATTQAGIATDKAGEASTSASNALASELAAEAARDAALAALDDFDDRYLGPKSTEPTLDNDGDPLVAGALYFNTSDPVGMRVYTGTEWVDAYASGQMFLTKAANLGDLPNAATARTNLGLGTAATTDSTAYATSAQGALADSAVQPGDLATVATSGSYNDLSNLPTLGTAAATNVEDYATAAQGALADSAIQPNTDATLNKLTTTTLQFTGGTGTQGTLSWNADEETLDLIQNGSTQQIGQETFYHVRNNTGVTIPNGTAVYATGTIGMSGRITVAPFIANGSIPAKFMLGVTTEDIDNGTDGKVTQFGKIRGLDTSGFSEGAVLWASPTTAGALTATEPTAPNVKLPIAFVISSSSTVGTIFVRATVSATAEQGALADSAVQPNATQTLTNKTIDGGSY